MIAQLVSLLCLDRRQNQVGLVGLIGPEESVRAFTTIQATETRRVLTPEKVTDSGWLKIPDSDKVLRTGVSLMSTWLYPETRENWNSMEQLGDSPKGVQQQNFRLGKCTLVGERSDHQTLKAIRMA